MGGVGGAAIDGEDGGTGGNSGPDNTASASGGYGTGYYGTGYYGTDSFTTSNAITDGGPAPTTGDDPITTTTTTGYDPTTTTGTTTGDSPTATTLEMTGGNPQPCYSTCDCPSSTQCIGGVCEPSAQSVFCCLDEMCPAGEMCQTPQGAVSVCGYAGGDSYG